MAEVVALPGMAYSRSGNAPAKAKRWMNACSVNESKKKEDWLDCFSC